MLKVGRHFRLSGSAKAVVGRDDAENTFIEGLAAGRWLFEATAGGSPLTLLMGSETEEELGWAARLTARYSDLKESESVSVLARRGDQRVLRTVVPASEAEIAPKRL